MISHFQGLRLYWEDMQKSQGCTAAEAAPVDMAERIPQPAPRPLPPYNGFGSLEDSAQSCRSLIPQVMPRGLGFLKTYPC